MLESAWFPLVLTLKVSIISTIIVSVLGVLISYVMARKDFRGKWLVDVLTTLPLVLPPAVTGYLLVILLGKNGMIGKYIFDLTGTSVKSTL